MSYLNSSLETVQAKNMQAASAKRRVAGVSVEDIELQTEAQKRGLGVPEQHQLKIAKSTLKMSDAGATIMGGMTKDQARAFLKSVGYTDEEIAKLEA